MVTLVKGLPALGILEFSGDTMLDLLHTHWETELWRSRHFLLVSFPRELGVPLSPFLAGIFPHKSLFPYSVEAPSLPPPLERSGRLGGQLWRASRDLPEAPWPGDSPFCFLSALEEGGSIWELRWRRWGSRTLTFCRPEPVPGWTPQIRNRSMAIRCCWFSREEWEIKKLPSISDFLSEVTEQLRLRSNPEPDEHLGRRGNF